MQCITRTVSLKTDALIGRWKTRGENIVEIQAVLYCRVLFCLPLARIEIKHAGPPAVCPTGQHCCLNKLKVAGCLLHQRTVASCVL